MPHSTAFTAFAALGLTVIAGLSAAAVTIDHGTTSATPAGVTQYVDQYGNPVAAPGSDTATAAGSTASTPDRNTTPVVRDTGGEDHESEGGED